MNGQIDQIGTPGVPWGTAEKARWRASRRRVRSHGDEVVGPVMAMDGAWEVERYGVLEDAEGNFPLLALRSRQWITGLPVALVTGGVHGYETSGVQGALLFAREHAASYAGRVNLIVVPCVSPWAYERLQRWNPDAVDPNRSFRQQSPAIESTALMRLTAPLRGQFLLHVDLHETTDSDETEFRPALAARDGKPFEAGHVPDGFYLVADSERPMLAFQQAVIETVAEVTHIAPADGDGRIIGSPVLAPGVIAYPVADLGLCAGITGAPYVTTTEVYPDSPRADTRQCNQAQVVAVCAALDHALAHPRTGHGPHQH